MSSDPPTSLSEHSSFQHLDLFDARPPDSEGLSVRPPAPGVHLSGYGERTLTPSIVAARNVSHQELAAYFDGGARHTHLPRTEEENLTQARHVGERAARVYLEGVIASGDVPTTTVCKVRSRTLFTGCDIAPELMEDIPDALIPAIDVILREVSREFQLVATNRLLEILRRYALVEPTALVALMQRIVYLGYAK